MPVREYIDYTASLPKEKTLVCVTDQKKCDRIIDAGRRLADITSSDLTVITVARPEYEQDPQSMEYLFSVAQKNDAEMSILFSGDVSKAIIQYIKENKISNVLTGVPKGETSLAPRLWKKFTHITFFVVEEDGALREIIKPQREAAKIFACEAYSC